MAGEILTEERSGIFVVDKPAGMSSFGVVHFLRKKLGVRRMGHAGTLDPAATGLLIILAGKLTKKFGDFQSLRKTYEATMELGKTTDTGDATGEVTSIYKREIIIDKPHFEEVVSGFCGQIEQVPHPYSAIKYGGKRSYLLARKGKPVLLAARPVSVYKTEVRAVHDHEAKLVFEVSSGTYIRSLVEDIGKKMGYGAYVKDLRRTSVGEWNILSAKIPQEVEWGDLICVKRNGDE